MANAKRDENRVPTLIGVSSADGTTPVNVYVDPTTHRLKVDMAAGTGTVTSVSVVSANGLAGTVATATTTPAITLSTTVTGLLKGNGTAISAATAGTDYTALAFKTISVSGQSDVVADTAADTLTLVAGTNVTITTDAATDSITINSSGGASGITVGTTTVTGGTTTKVLYDNAGVVGEYTVSGSGSVAMTTSPVFTTPNLGTPSAAVLTNATGTASGLTAGAVTNATLTTALTVNTGTVTLVGNVANTSVLTIGAGSVSVSGSNTGDQTSVSGNAGTATALQTARTIGGVSFDGTANITVATATGGFTVSGGALALGTQNLTMTGSLAATGARVTKGWFTDLESTNMPTVGGTAILTSLTAPQFTTIELGHASDTTLARVSAGVISVEGVRVITSSGTTSGTILKNNGTTFVASTETYAAPGTSGNVMTSDGTNWTSAAPGAPAGIGWALKSYTSGTSALPISISSLDLATDLSYKILYQIEITNSSTASSLRVTFNTVTTANYNTMYAYDRNGGGTYASGTNAGNGNSYITIQANTMRSHFGEMNLALTKDDGTNKRPRMECVNNGFTQSDLTVSFDRTRSVGWLDNATNITSVEIKELSVTGTPTYAWRVWVYKSTTS